MGSERLVVLEEDLKYVIKIIRYGIRDLEPEMPDHVIEKLKLWCDRMEKSDG